MTDAWNPEGRPVDKTRIPADVFTAAFNAAFPGLPDGITKEQAERRIAAALNEAWPRIDGNAAARLAAVRELAESWAALAPADDWGESATGTVLADAGRTLLAVLDGETSNDASGDAQP